MKHVKRLNIYLPLLFMLLAFNLHAQNSRVDSLKNKLQDLGLDTARVNTLNEIADELYRADPDGAIQYASEAKSLAEMISYPGGEAMAYKNLGLGYYMQGNFVEALRNWEPSLEIYQEQGDDQLVANLLNNMGAIYHSLGKNLEAIEYYIPALKLAEELNDSTRIGTLLLNIGVIDSEKSDTYDTARNYYLRAIEFGEDLGDIEILGIGSINLGEVYMEMEEYDSALFYFEKSLTHLTSPIDVATALNFIGAIYTEKGDFQQAFTYRQDALEMARRENAQRVTVEVLMGMAATYSSLEDPDRAIAYFKQAEELAEEIGMNQELSAVYGGLAANYAQLQDYTTAYEYLALQNEIDDIFYRIESEGRTTDLINSYEMEKKQNEITLLEQKSVIDQLRSKRQRGMIIGTAVFGLLILALSIGLYNRMRYIRQTNQKINMQKQLITDSITYAQRIQSAVLPST